MQVRILPCLLVYGFVTQDWNTGMRTISLKISAHMRLKRLQKIISDPAWNPTKKTREFWTAIRDYHLDLTDDQLRQKKPVPSY